MGMTPKYKTPEELQSKIDEYFDEIVETKDKITITGLVLYLGFCDRQSFHDYEKRESFSFTIKKARTRIENHYEKNLTGSNPAGPIFALKNFSWTDKTEIDLTSQGDKIENCVYIVPGFVSDDDAAGKHSKK